jgi:tyrosinase
MTNGEVHVRQNVWVLSRATPDGWHSTLHWYAQAIRQLKRMTNSADPRSWMHLSNIHGTEDEPSTWPPGITDRHWNACQHTSWYFLPWHRMYLHHFEKIVRQVVRDLGGPSEWTLPFWEYDPSDPQTLSLPPAFLAETRGDDPNPLFVYQRRALIRAGGGVPADAVDKSDWSDEFTSDDPNVASFGGPETGWSHVGGEGDLVGELENEPHGLVHGRVGGSDAYGYMSLFETAPRDPIFWLHHANIDRRWELWRNVAGHDNPDAKKWLDQAFEFGSGSWHTEMRVRDVLVTTHSPLSYQYDGVPVPSTDEVGRRSVRRSMKKPPAELVGSTEGAIPLGASVNVTVGVNRPVGPRAWAARRNVDAQAGAARTYLVLENVSGTTITSDSYAVYIGVPEGEDPAAYPERRVGNLAMFGVPEASRPDSPHGGSGRKFSFDITPIVAALEESESWDPNALRVALVGRDPAPGVSGAGDVRIGAIKLYQR